MAEEETSRDFEETYRERTRSSERAFDEASAVLPGGVGGSAPSYEPYPFFVEEAEGSKVRDVDGNEYIDFNLSWGVLAVGHQHPKLVEGLREQLGRGTMYGLPHEETTEVAEELTRRFPMEKLRFTNSGSESTLYAVRLARRFTGKDKIVKIEGAYHGVSDSLHISKKPPVGEAGHRGKPNQVPHGGGIPDDVQEDTLVVPFNDLHAMERVLEDNLSEVAAIFVEPVMMNAGVIPPEDGYLEGLRKLADEHNVLLVFDETKTGVKIAPGGAADYYDVEPDLITLAKAIGGGLPIGAVGGRADVLAGIGDEGLFGTYSANPLSIRASKITLTEILTDDQYEKFEEFGSELYDGYRDIIEDESLTARVQDVGGIGGPLFTDSDVTNYRDWTKVDDDRYDEYWFRMVNNGVIPTCFGSDEEATISVAHTAEDIQRHLDAFSEVASKL